MGTGLQMRVRYYMIRGSNSPLGLRFCTRRPCRPAGARGELDLDLVRLEMDGMDSGLYDLVVELGTAIEASYGEVGEGSAVGGARHRGRRGERRGLGVSLRRGVRRAACLAAEEGGLHWSFLEACRFSAGVFW